MKENIMKFNNDGGDQRKGRKWWKVYCFGGRGLDRQKTAHKEKLLMLPTSPQWTSGEKEKLSVSLKKIRRKLSPPTCVLCIHVTINEHKIVSIFFFGFSLFILAHHPSHTQPTNKSFTPFAMGEKKEPPYLVVHTFTLSLSHSLWSCFESYKYFFIC